MQIAKELTLEFGVASVEHEKHTEERKSDT